MFKNHISLSTAWYGTFCRSWFIVTSRLLCGSVFFVKLMGLVEECPPVTVFDVIIQAHMPHVASTKIPQSKFRMFYELSSVLVDLHSKVQ